MKRKLIFVFRLFVSVWAKKQETIKRKLIFVFRLFVLVWGKKQKMIKQKSIAVFIFLFKSVYKTKNDKTEVGLFFACYHSAEVK